jgi:hypothetical protein
MLYTKSRPSALEYTILSILGLHGRRHPHSHKIKVGGRHPHHLGGVVHHPVHHGKRSHQHPDAVIMFGEHNDDDDIDMTTIRSDEFVADDVMKKKDEAGLCSFVKLENPLTINCQFFVTQNISGAIQLEVFL